MTFFGLLLQNLIGVGASSANGDDSPLTRGSPAGSLNKKHYSTTRSGGSGLGVGNGSGNASNSDGSHPERKISKMQMGE